MAKGGRQRSLTAIFASVNTKESRELPAQPLAPDSPANAISSETKIASCEAELCSLPLNQEQAEPQREPLCPGNDSVFSTPLRFAAPACNTAEAHRRGREAGFLGTPRQQLVSGAQNYAIEAELAASAIAGDAEKPIAAPSAEAEPFIPASQVQWAPLMCCWVMPQLHSRASHAHVHFPALAPVLSHWALLVSLRFDHGTDMQGAPWVKEYRRNLQSWVLMHLHAEGAPSWRDNGNYRIFRSVRGRSTIPAQS